MPSVGFWPGAARHRHLILIIITTRRHVNRAFLPHQRPAWDWQEPTQAERLTEYDDQAVVQRLLRVILMFAADTG